MNKISINLLSLFVIYDDFIKPLYPNSNLITRSYRLTVTEMFPPLGRGRSGYETA